LRESRHETDKFILELERSSRSIFQFAIYSSRLYTYGAATIEIIPTLLALLRDSLGETLGERMGQPGGPPPISNHSGNIETGAVSVIGYQSLERPSIGALNIPSLHTISSKDD
jgi:hypothetical protein